LASGDHAKKRLIATTGPRKPGKKEKSRHLPKEKQVGWGGGNRGKRSRDQEKKKNKVPVGEEKMRLDNFPLKGKKKKEDKKGKKTAGQRKSS